MKFRIHTQNIQDPSDESTSLLKATPNSEPMLIEGTNGGVSSRIKKSETLPKTATPVSILVCYFQLSNTKTKYIKYTCYLKSMLTNINNSYLNVSSLYP